MYGNLDVIGKVLTIIMNFMTWSMRLEYVCKLHTCWVISGMLVLLLVPITCWGLAAYWYVDNYEMERTIQELVEVGQSNHEAVARYTDQLKILMTKDTSHTVVNSMLVHMVDCANSHLVLDTIIFTETGFTITGMSTTPEVALAYSQKLKSVLKGVTINEKQGIDATRKVHTFQLSGRYGKSDASKKTDNKINK
ncbi:Uncharacterised protein [Veillonella criceti]|uniref:Uncharacterized protein n=2 Tax=Veillonella criceti TaxID=103891 RepID=A0A380NKR5_9FIRM|nr:Uncharacterised protein [Veillonella criceti]